jgi:hypothetical protein
VPSSSAPISSEYPATSAARTAARRPLAVIPPTPPCADFRAGERGLPTGTTADALGRTCRTRPGRPGSLFSSATLASSVRPSCPSAAARKRVGLRPLRERPDRIVRPQLARVAKQAKAALQTDTLEAVAGRGYFNGEEIVTCDQAGITVTMPKPMTSGAKSEGRFGKQDFAYLPEDDVYRCPAGERLKYYYTNVKNGLKLRRYWTNACRTCALESRCTTAVQRRITRWEHGHVLEAVQRRLDEDPQAMRRRRETVEHPFGTIKARTGATHFLMKTLPRVAGEMALHVLACNLTRVINIMGPDRLIAAIRT